MLISSRIIFFLVCFLIFLIALKNIIKSQENSNNPISSMDGIIYRIGFLEMLHQTFLTEGDHPFYQMTGSNRYLGGKGYQDIPSFNPTDFSFPYGISTNINMKRDLDGEGHNSVDSTLGKILDYFPTFSLEIIIPTDYFIYTGLSFHYTSTWQEDVKIRSATMGADP